MKLIEISKKLEEVIEREVVKINDFLDQDNSRSFTKNAKCWEDLKDSFDNFDKQKGDNVDAK